jgi:hypothetical protein
MGFHCSAVPENYQKNIPSNLRKGDNMSINYDSPTLAPPRIEYGRFLQLLQSKNSPAVPEAIDIWNIFIGQGVDPSFALAQYRVESQYGTAGHAVVTGSWGNMLYDSNLTKLAVSRYSPGNGYTYAVYDSYRNAAIDYARYLHWYKDKYNLYTIYEATARWIGKVPGSSGHISYINIVINDMYEYEFQDGKFYEVGDKMIYGGAPFDRATGRIVQKYPVINGMPLYRGTDGSILKNYSGPSSKIGDLKSYAWYLGLVQGSTDWGMICIGTSVADADATWCYIQNIDTNKIVNV